MTKPVKERRIGVGVLNPGELFGEQIHYQIPRFQRRYIWNKEKHWRQLWADVERVADQCCSGGKPNPHFLGAVVLQHVDKGVGQTQTRLVVDGQQRLTTLQLLIDAIHKSYSERGYEPDEPLYDLVWNEHKSTDDNVDHVFKVWPTVIDQPSFSLALSDEPIEDLDSPIILAHEYFRNEVDKWLDADPKRLPDRVEALLRASRNLLHIVVIDLTANDNPHVIFESLNARGESLLESDLIKNMVMYEADRAGIVDGTTNADWLWDFNDRWWVTEIGRGRIKQARIDIFLNQWLIMRTAKFISNDDVFLAFRRYYTDDVGQPIHKIAIDIKNIGDIYRSIETEKSHGGFEFTAYLRQFLYRRRIMQLGVITPVLLWLFSTEIPSDQLEKGIRALESHAIRRMMLRNRTAGLNRTYVELIRILLTSDPMIAGDVIVGFLSRKDSNVASWPTDAEVEEAFLNQNSYRGLTRGRLRIVLEGLEQGLRSEKAEEQEPRRNLTIEHVMPQEWRDNYPLLPGIEPEDRDHTIHTLGNLTLVNRPLNSAMSNAPWIGKREELRKHSTLFLNKEMVDDHHGVTWGEAQIEARARRLSQLAIKVWPYADQL